MYELLLSEQGNNAGIDVWESTDSFGSLETVKELLELVSNFDNPVLEIVENPLKDLKRGLYDIHPETINGVRYMLIINANLDSFLLYREKENG